MWKKVQSLQATGGTTEIPAVKDVISVPCTGQELSTPWLLDTLRALCPIDARLSISPVCRAENSP